MQRRNCFILFFSVVILIFFLSCQLPDDDKENVADPYTISAAKLTGTLNNSNANGKTANITLVPEGETWSGTHLFNTVSTVFSGNNATFSVNVIYLRYTLWVCINMDGDDPMNSPETGDYVANVNVNVMTKDIVQNITSWSIY